MNPKSTIRIDIFSFRFDKLKHRLEPDAILPHQIRNGKAGTARNASSTVDKHLSFLVYHLVHPIEVVLEVMDDWLAWKIVNLIVLIAVFWIRDEGCLQVSSAYTNGGNSALIENLLGGSCILIAKKDFRSDLIDLGILLPQAFKIFGLLNLLVIAFLANGSVLRASFNVLSCVALIAIDD